MAPPFSSAAFAIAFTLVEPASGVEIAWNGPAACTDGTRVQAAVDELIRAPREDLAARADVTVVHDGERLRADVEIVHEAETSHRTLRAAECGELQDAVALVVAVAVDPLGASATVSDALQEQTAPVEATDALPEPPIAIPLAEPTVDLDVELGSDAEPPTATPVRVPLQGSAHVMGGGDLGLVVGAGGVLGGGLALDISRGRIELAAVHRFATMVRQREQPDVGARFTLTAGRVSGCGVPGVGRFSVPMCAGVELGSVVGQGSGLDDNRTTYAVWAGVVPHVRPTVRATSWLAFGLDLQLPIALTRPRFGIADFPDSDLLRVGRVGFRFGLAVELVFVSNDPNFFGRQRRRPGNRGRG